MAISAVAVFCVMQVAFLFVFLIVTTASTSNGEVEYGSPQVIIAGLLAIPVWLLLAWREWTVSVTLTADTLVIRNALTTRRIPLARIRGVTLTRVRLRVSESYVPLPPNGRGGIRRYSEAGWPGGAYWTGYRCATDEAAEAIAAAAGLSPLAPRRQKLGPLQSWLLLAACLACVVAFFVFGPTGHDAPANPLVFDLTLFLLYGGGMYGLPIAVSAVISHVRHAARAGARD